MKFGLFYNTAYYGPDPDLMAAVARHAEGCGFESFYVPDRAVVRPPPTPGSVTFPPEPVPDPLNCLTFVAAVTSQLLLGTAVLLLPYYDPLVLASRLATIDVLSRGRMSLLTVGLGARPDDAGAVGVDFATRGRRADEAIDALRLLWTADEEGGYHPGTLPVTAVGSRLKPYRRRVLPIHVGGSSRAAARRAGRRGDGYFPRGKLPLEEQNEQVAIMLAEAAAAGRDPMMLEYTRCGQIDMTADDVHAQARRGVTRLVVTPVPSEQMRIRTQMSSFARRLGLG